MNQRLALGRNEAETEFNQSSATDLAGVIPLSRLRVGQRSRIAAVEGSHSEIARLAEMGLRRGVEFVVLRGGKTSILRINRSQLCLRLGRETSIRVRPID